VRAREPNQSMQPIAYTLTRFGPLMSNCT
jgi:hypothetical protein